LLAAMMLLHPGQVSRAILLRPVMVLDEAPAANLSGTRLLTLSGSHDPYRALAPALDQALRQAGAGVDAKMIEAGHELTEADRTLSAEWLKREGAQNAEAN
jgi:phospholipase/carboxylesterase